MSSVLHTIALLVLVCLISVNGLYFHVPEGTEKCFLEDVPRDTVVSMTYKSYDHDELMTKEYNDPDSLHSAMFMTVKDPKGKEVSRLVTDEDGTTAFTSTMGGEYAICLATNTTRFRSRQRKFKFGLQMSYGEEAIDYSGLAKQEHLSAIEVEIRKLNDKIRDVRKEQEYQKKREEVFRDLSESTFSKVKWWSIIQTVVLVVSGLWQIRSLKGFFKSKKLA